MLSVLPLCEKCIYFAVYPAPGATSGHCRRRPDPASPEVSASYGCGEHSDLEVVRLAAAGGVEVAAVSNAFARVLKVTV